MPKHGVCTLAKDKEAADPDPKIQSAVTNQQSVAFQIG